jgi:hypothetical protein
MSIFVPLVLVVMPMSVGIGSLAFVVAVIGMFAFTAIYASRPKADARTAQALAAHGVASSDAASHLSRVECIAKLYAAARKNRTRHGTERRDEPFGWAAPRWIASLRSQ